MDNKLELKLMNQDDNERYDEIKQKNESQIELKKENLVPKHYIYASVLFGMIFIMIYLATVVLNYLFWFNVFGNKSGYKCIVINISKKAWAYGTEANL